MGKLIVTAFITLDGVVEDPDGRGGTSFGGWAFRFGPQAIADDKFKLGSIFDEGALLFGRKTWAHFSQLWPTRDSAFAKDMNRVAKIVATQGNPDLSAWSNSTKLTGDLVENVVALRSNRDIAVIGSLSVAQQLAKAGVVDEYRLITFPTVLGDGARLLIEPMELELVSVEAVGQATMTTYSVG